MKKLTTSIALLLFVLSSIAQTTNYNVRWANHPADVKNYDTQRLRKEFLIDKVFAPNEINWTYTMYDRFLIGGAEPVGMPLELNSIEPLKAKTLLENRELGIINVGGEGTVTIDGKVYNLGFQEGIYIGRSTAEHPNRIVLSSKDS